MYGTGNIYIEYNLPANLTGKDAVIEILSIDGTMVYRTVNRIAGINSNFAWDESDRTGKHVSAGSYIVNLVAGNTKLSSRVSIVR
jgi:flagellar hook assembly protein FlgD